MAIKESSPILLAAVLARVRIASAVAPAQIAADAKALSDWTRKKARETPAIVAVFKRYGIQVVQTPEGVALAFTCGGWSADRPHPYRHVFRINEGSAQRSS